MNPNKWMSKIYQAFAKYHNTVFMFGDTNQCDLLKRVAEYTMIISSLWQFLRCVLDASR